MNSDTLATELLKELKASARRWFIAFCVMCGLELCTIGGFIWYATLPVEETVYTQETELDNNSRSMQIIQGDYNGESETDSTKDEER